MATRRPAVGWVGMSVGYQRHEIDALFSADPYAAGLGVELIEVTPETVSLGLDVTEAHANFLGVGHGGMVFSLADCAFSLASNAAGDRAVAIDTHLVLTAPSRPGDRLIATAREASRSRSLGTYRVDVRREDGRTVGLFTGTVFISTR